MKGCKHREAPLEPPDLGSAELARAAIEKDAETPARPVIQKHADFIADHRLGEKLCDVSAALCLVAGEAVERDHSGALRGAPVLVKRIIDIINVEIFAHQLIGKIAV